MMTMTTVLLRCLNLHPRKVNLKHLPKKLAGNSNLPAKKASIANKVVMKDQ